MELWDRSSFNRANSPNPLIFRKGSALCRVSGGGEEPNPTRTDVTFSLADRFSYEKADNEPVKGRIRDGGGGRTLFESV